MSAFIHRFTSAPPEPPVSYALAQAAPSVSPAMSHFFAWLSGTSIGLGLFAVVGAQTAFILRQGLMRAHVGAVVLTCALIDAVCITASVTGLQWLTARVPGLTQTILWFGVAFLLWYGGQCALRAWRPGAGLAASRHAAPSRRAAIAGAFAFTLLNPHFWLDIVVLGSLANSFQSARLAFAGGAITASVLWLTALGAGATLLAPWLRRPRAWRVLDGGIAVVMGVIALRLMLMAE